MGNYFDRFEGAGAGGYEHAPPIPAAPVPAPAPRPQPSTSSARGNYFDRFEAGAKATAPEPSWLERVGSTLANAGETAWVGMGRMARGLDTAIGVAADAVGADGVADWAHGRADELKRQEGTFSARNLADATTFEQVKANPLGNLPAFVVEQGLGGLPDMALAVGALPAYLGLQSGAIAGDRAANDGRARAGMGDLAVGAATALPSAWLERVGARGMFGAAEQAAESLLKGTGKAALKEGATEFGQGVIEYTGTNAGTKAGFDPSEAMDQGLAGLASGAPFGGLVHTTVHAPARMRSWIDGGPTPREADLPYGSLDGEVLPPMQPGLPGPPERLALPPPVPGEAIYAGRASLPALDGPQASLALPGPVEQRALPAPGRLTGDETMIGTPEGIVPGAPGAVVGSAEPPIISAPDAGVRGDDLPGLLSMLYDRVRSAEGGPERVAGPREVVGSRADQRAAVQSLWERLDAFRRGGGEEPEFSDLPPVPRVSDDTPPVPRSVTQTPAPATGESVAYVKPVNGAMTSGFGQRKSFKTNNGAAASRNHRGVDYGAPEGAQVSAVADGEVVFAGKRGGYGNQVRVRHADGSVSTYSHLSAMGVKVGARVGRGSGIGAVGQTGNATGPHLHFELIRDGKHVDPSGIFDGRQAPGRLADAAPTMEPARTAPEPVETAQPSEPPVEPVQRVEPEMAPVDLEPVKLAEGPPSAPETPIVEPTSAASGNLSADGRGYRMATFRPEDIHVDAPLMQFKAGGDENGVTERLAGVTKWEPDNADPVIVWEDENDRPVIVDGHQRLGLGKRLSREGQNILMDARVYRAADGYTASRMRTMAAIKNIVQGSGTIVDAAKVFRELDAPALERLASSLPKRGPEAARVRDGQDVARLSPDAFGAVVNEVIPGEYGAAIARALPDKPDAHKGMVDLLHEIDPATRGQAEAVVRQAINAGFSRETQTDMFGDQGFDTSLFKPKAQVVESTKRLLRGLKTVHNTAAKGADVLEQSGSTIAREASAQEAKNSAEAAELIDRLAFRTGNPVGDAVDAAAVDLAAGRTTRDGAAKRVAGAVRGLDLQALARGADDGSGRGAGDGGRRAESPGKLAAGSLGLDAEQSTTARSPEQERARAEVDARVQQSALSHTDQVGLGDQDGGLFDSARDQTDMFGESGAKGEGPGEFLKDLWGDESGHISADMLMAPVEALAVATKHLDRFGSAVAYSADGALRTLSRHYKAPTMAKLADMFQARAGAADGTGRTYDEALKRSGGLYRSRLDEALAPHIGDKAALGRIRDLLTDPKKPRGRKPEEHEAATKIRDLLKDVLAYRRAAGEELGEVSDGYFPRVLDTLAVVKDRGKFTDGAEKVYRAMGVDNPEEAAAAWLLRITDTHAGVDGGLAHFGGTAKPSSAKSREFGKLADEVLKDFYQADPHIVLSDYITGSVRRAEQTRRFGPKGAYGSPERDAWMKAHGSKTQWDVMREQIRDEVRESGEDATGVMDRIAGIRDSNLGKLTPLGARASSAVATIHAWNQLSTLERATLSSVGDMAMGFVRGGPTYGVRHFAKTVSEVARAVTPYVDHSPSDARRWAEAMGTVGSNTASELIRARSDAAPGAAKHAVLMDKFYRGIGLTQLTDGGRTAATENGRIMVETLAHDLVGNIARTRSRAQFYLRELGIQDPEAFGAWLRKGAPSADELGKDSGFAADYATAVIRFADQSVLMPTRAQKPTWSNHPVGSLVFALQSYTAAFTQNVLKRVGRTAVQAAKTRDPALLAPVAGMLVLGAMTALQDHLRAALFGSSKSRDEESTTDYALRIADRAGATGMLSPFLNAIKGLRYQRSMSASLQGAVIGRASDAADAAAALVVGNTDGTNTAERKAAGLVYDMAINPIANAFGADKLPKGAGSALIFGTGNKEGGMLPGDKDWFVDKMAGPKED